MSANVNQHIKYLQRRRENPARGIIAATAIGREASLLRQELDKPAPLMLGPGEAGQALEALAATLNDMDVSSQQRAAAAWALGQIGGLQPARDLLDRLETLFVHSSASILGSADHADQAEAKAVNATLVQALAQALDETTVRDLNQFDLQQLRRVCNAFLDSLLNEADPDLSTAMAMSLAKLTLRAQAGLLQDILQELLEAPEPVATLAAIGAISELISVKQNDKNLDYLYDMQPNAILDDTFKELEASRGRPYSDEERRRLLQLAAQFRYTEQVARFAGDQMWQEIENPQRQ